MFQVDKEDDTYTEVGTPKMALVRHAGNKDKLPCLVSDQLFIGKNLPPSIWYRHHEHLLQAFRQLTHPNTTKSQNRLIKTRNQPTTAILRLYPGSAAAARNLKALRKRGVTHILNASPVVPCYFQQRPPTDDGPHFSYLTIPLFDDPAADLLVHLPQAIAFINEGRAAGGVLVHCFAGQSRSAALIMAYMMESYRLDLAEAWQTVRNARPCALPNPGFLRQLAEYQTQLECTRDAVVLAPDSPRYVESDSSSSGEDDDEIFNNMDGLVDPSLLKMKSRKSRKYFTAPGSYAVA